MDSVTAVSPGRNTRPAFWVPECFDPMEILPCKMWLYADAARCFLGTIARKSMCGRSDDDGFVRLNSGIMRQTIGQRAWQAIQTALDGLVETSPHIAGLRCRGYRFAQEMLGPLRRTRLVEPGLVARIQDNYARWKRRHEEILLSIHRQLYDIQQAHLTIDRAAEAETDTLSDRARPLQRALIETIRQRRTGFTVSATGRCFNAITGLARDLRPYVRLDGEQIVGLDIVGAQPGLLGAILTLQRGKRRTNIIHTHLPSLSVVVPRRCVEWGVGSRSVASKVINFFELVGRVDGLGRDVADFADLAMAGEFYEALLDLCELRGVPMPNSDARGWAKKRFVVDVLNFSGRYFSDVARVFSERWPTVFSFIAEANSQCPGTVISALQAAEAALVILSVAQKLVPHTPVLSLHDSVYCRERDLPLVNEAFERTFEEMGFRLSLKEAS